MAQSTLDELSSFSETERALSRLLLDSDGPSEESLDRILSYSRALSVRKTENGRPVRMVLN